MLFIYLFSWKDRVELWWDVSVHLVWVSWWDVALNLAKKKCAGWWARITVPKTKRQNMKRVYKFRGYSLPVRSCSTGEWFNSFKVNKSWSCKPLSLKQLSSIHDRAVHSQEKHMFQFICCLFGLHGATEIDYTVDDFEVKKCRDCLKDLN